MTAIDPKAQLDVATRLLGGFSVPDTPVISRAIDFARERSEPYLFNHVMRSWLFAALLAQTNQTAHDGEVLAVTTILHDIGLAESFDGPLRFEVEGANAARAFARNEGMDDRRAQLIWDGVALNSTPSIALYKEPEIAIATMGIGLDWGEFGDVGLTVAVLAQAGARVLGLGILLLVAREALDLVQVVALGAREMASFLVQQLLVDPCERAARVVYVEEDDAVDLDLALGH